MPARPPARPGGDARRQRDQLQRARQERARKRTVAITSAGVILVVAVAIVIGVGVTRAGPTSARTGSAPSVDPANLPGLATTAAPWSPEYAHLPARLAALGLPPNGDESYHIHAHLTIYVNGQPVPVPADVGISEADQIESPMHTHDTSGVVHIEAAHPSDAFTLGAFMDLWGVTFTDTQLGIYTATAGKALQVFVNGELTAHPDRYPLHPHDDIVIDYGVPGAAPNSVPFNWSAAGL